MNQSFEISPVPSSDPEAYSLPAAESATRGGEFLQNPDLETILAAWEMATRRLERTHQTLRDEVRRLTDELEVKNRELARKNRLADLGQMASHVAHEVRNGLAPAKLYLSQLKRRVRENQGALEIVEKVDRGIASLETTVSDLLQFASDREPVRNTFPVRGFLEEIGEALAPQLESQGIRVEVDATATLRLEADRNMLQRAVLNLVLNAVDAMPSGGELTLAAYPVAGGVDIEVSDSGPGVGEGLLGRVFEPFFTTKPEGTGLGLAIVLRIAEVHGGTVHVSNCPQGGAAFTIHLPNWTRENVK